MSVGQAILKPLKAIKPLGKPKPPKPMKPAAIGPAKPPVGQHTTWSTPGKTGGHAPTRTKVGDLGSTHQQTVTDKGTIRVDRATQGRKANPLWNPAKTHTTTQTTLGPKGKTAATSTSMERGHLSGLGRGLVGGSAAAGGGAVGGYQYNKRTQVGKALVNGKFVKIASLPKAERAAHKLAIKGSYRRAARTKDPKIEEFRGTMNHPSTKRLVEGLKDPKKSERALADFANQHNFGAFTMRRGGKNTGSSHVFVNPDTEKAYTSKKMYARHAQHVGAHEAEHANPKRSGYRMHQVISDPYKLGKEEARADYMSSGHYKKSNFRKTPLGESISGYPAKASQSKVQSVVLRMSGHDVPKNSTFHEGYREMHDTLKKKGVKPKNNFYSKPNAAVYNNRGKIAAGGAAIGGGGAGFGYYKTKLGNEADEVKKSGPDQADVHVTGTLRRVRKLRKES